MKIKEVIEKTGLTDRAIRLYIDEGLVVPSIGESYSGRKSIEFSQEDVERLKNVAMLRKAGFSIADIKRIVTDKSAIKGVVGNFIEQTEGDISRKTEIIERLKGISFDEEVTLETICKSLSETVEKKKVPKEDLKLTAIEKILKIIAIIIGGLLLVNAVYWLALVCIEIFDVRYIKLTSDPTLHYLSLFYLGWVVIIVLSIIVILKNIGKRFNRKSKSSNAELIIISTVGTVIMFVATFILAFFSVTPLYSQTTDYWNYLEIDRALADISREDDGLYYALEMFPREIPSETLVKHRDSIKYFYEYVPCWDSSYGTYDICAEWILSDRDYKIFKNNLKGNFILENIINEAQSALGDEIDKMFDGIEINLEDLETESIGYEVIQKGDWTMIYYKGYGQVEFDYGLAYGEEPPNRVKDEFLYEESKNEFEISEWNADLNPVYFSTNYDFLICAYNDKEQKVRYIASACCGHTNREGGPYYLSLDW